MFIYIQINNLILFYIKLSYGHKRSANRLLSVPQVESLVLPIMIEPTTLESTPIWLFSYLKRPIQLKLYSKICNPSLLNLRRSDIITLGDIYYSTFKTKIWSITRFAPSQTQRRINALIMSILLFSPWCTLRTTLPYWDSPYSADVVSPTWCHERFINRNN